ncbi:MAG TPA: pyridoxamine 5'-phosphate oxidase family protein, partial [Croceibacterium sp.]|nr:pyridoxamine 5'-phosphate oxidase family protein [Croceibacterium sp.]
MTGELNAIPCGNPFALFEAWFAEARASEPNDPNAMALATATPDGAPSVRMVLLKEHGPDGFVFYTNAESRK